ncbi:hypothetical protein [Citrobacter portucalensis]|uniref:hypothetical protein n=1 Tax=Citrobacter portucalensis TaxID=1639133 RepID=UPI00226B17C4|nr:hypothetical protein [Citrobacter portucalensis]MCX9023994.1 hypothetical protein [Citrobacter portucalensis]
MSRTADYTIQGFLYQFNKALLGVLQSSETDVITIEGIIEDVEIESITGIEAIQCKYHETVDNFSYSSIYKPLLQMMQHFVKNPGNNITYVLFAHFPDLKNEEININKDVLEKALDSKDQKYSKYISDVSGNINIQAFLSKLKFVIGPSYEEIVKEVLNSFEVLGFSKDDIDTLFYPNAINTIAELSICHDVSQRKITKNKLLSDLKSIKKTAISHWTLSLKSKQILLTSRKKQLKPNLSKNARLRYFLINSQSLENFDSEIVMFISDYIDKYHFKPAHTQTPTFALHASKQQISDIRLRLYQKGVISHNGYIEDFFDENLFFRDPIISKRDGNFNREFHIRILHADEHLSILSKVKPADLYVIGESDFNELDVLDVNIESLGTTSFNEVKFMLGISDAYE